LRLAFDSRYSAKAGEPRNQIICWDQHEDCATLSPSCRTPEIDGNRIGIWGISNAAGHALTSARLTSASRPSSPSSAWPEIRRDSAADGAGKAMAQFMGF